MIIISKVSFVINKQCIEGELIGIFQFSEVIDESPFIGGHRGGVSAYPVALIKVGNELKEIPAKKIVYL